MTFMDIFQRRPNSKDAARERLKLVLIQDRVKCSPQVLEMMKTEILDVISKYMVIDEADLDFQICQNDGVGNVETVLQAHVPIRNMRKRGM